MVVNWLFLMLVVYGHLLLIGFFYEFSKMHVSVLATSWRQDTIPQSADSEEPPKGEEEISQPCFQSLQDLQGVWEQHVHGVFSFSCNFGWKINDLLFSFCLLGDVACWADVRSVSGRGWAPSSGHIHSVACTHQTKEICHLRVNLPYMCVCGLSEEVFYSETAYFPLFPHCKNCWDRIKKKFTIPSVLVFCLEILGLTSLGMFWHQCCY